MSEDATIQGFATLFEGRQDAYGCSDTDGTVSCWRNNIGATPADIVEQHLKGEFDWGVYPMVLRHTDHDGPTSRGEWQVRFGVVDLDVRAPGKSRFDFDTTSEARCAAFRLQAELGDQGVASWIEETKSGGMHVWVFAEDWVSAENMRNSLLWACEQSDVPTTEVNPKNAYLQDHSSLGNFIRLCYPGGLTPAYDGTRSIYGYEDGPAQFVDDALSERTPVAAFARIASHYRKPMAPAPMPFVGEPIEVTPDFLNGLPGFVRYVLREGMGRQTDRSAWLFYLACICKDESMSPESAVAVVSLADHLHTFKFSERPDAQKHYHKTVERAYAASVA